MTDESCHKDYFHRGSNSSIPEMIRQQNERQKQRSRPESAKLGKTGRPPSGRKPRPQSAKEVLPVAVASDVYVNALQKMGGKSLEYTYVMCVFGSFLQQWAYY